LVHLQRAQARGHRRGVTGGTAERPLPQPRRLPTPRPSTAA
jgi:hypothetical protein